MKPKLFKYPLYVPIHLISEQSSCRGTFEFPMSEGKKQNRRHCVPPPLLLTPTTMLSWSTNRFLTLVLRLPRLLCLVSSTLQSVSPVCPASASSSDHVRPSQCLIPLYKSHRIAASSSPPSCRLLRRILACRSASSPSGVEHHGGQAI